MENRSLLSPHVPPQVELLSYPSQHVFGPNAGEIIVRKEDYLSLGNTECLSDVIIDFVLNFLYREKFTDVQRDKVFIFPSQFYPIYSTNSSFAGWKSGKNKEKSASKKRYERVEGLIDATVDIFKKDFLVFPLFQDAHWFLAIVCYPILQNSMPFDGNTHELKTSCVLLFDSVKSQFSLHSTALLHIRNFLKSHREKICRGQAKIGKLKSCLVKCPSQTNNFDGGCFILEFFKRFFITDPVNDFCLPINKSDWFEPVNVGLNKRREIRDIIRQLQIRKRDEANNRFKELLEMPALLSTCSVKKLN